jgi:hypothetical protein
MGERVACNNCVVLMWLTQSKIYGNEYDDQGAFAEDMSHNLGQARKSLALWKRYPICGKNDWQRFYLPRKKDTRIVVLSFVKSGDGNFSVPAPHGCVEIHTNWAQEQGVVLCATIAQAFLERLAAMGGSILDLIVLLADFRTERIIPEPRAIEILNNYRIDCIRMSEELKPEEYGHPGFNELSVANLAVLSLTLAQIRHRPTQVRGENAPTAIGENIGARYGILSDMALGDVSIIAKALTVCVELAQMSKEPRFMDLDLRDYDCRVGAAERAESEALFKQTFEAWAIPRRAGAERPGLFIYYIREMTEVRCWPVPRIGPSYTERLLDSLRQPPPGASSA